MFFQGHNDTLLSSGIEPGVDNLWLPSLRSYLPSCTAIIAEISASSVFPQNATAQCSSAVKTRMSLDFVEAKSGVLLATSETQQNAGVLNEGLQSPH